MSKAQTLAEIWGHDEPTALLMETGFDSIVPAICTNSDCDCDFEMEPDQRAGWCDNCETNSVKSIMVLLGVI